MLGHRELCVPVTDWADFLRPALPTGGVEVPENGHGFLVAWLLGPKRVHASASGAVRRFVEVTTSDGERWAEPRTPYDQAVIDDSINGYLAEAGIPPRPRQLAWAFTFSIDVETEMWERVNSVLMSANDVMADTHLRVLDRSRDRWEPRP